MSGEDFDVWLELMKRKGHNKGECARLLGRGHQWITFARHKGTDKAIALACAALLAGMQPFTAKEAA
ncbi:hypothetical protein [Rhizobium mesoamericanum]|uniref:hypothetical protein n=1 Tax=Rhizobium mesoamericanum TaxID=1079800 RepID=UPI000428A169|nr:hypothetical protein [Rhizobium mesoamericanum]